MQSVYLKYETSETKKYFFIILDKLTNYINYNN